MTLNWADENTGNGDTTDNGTRSGSFYDDVLVQTVDGSGNVLSTLSSAAQQVGKIAAGGSSPQHYTVQLPDGSAGTGNLKITITTDYYNQVFEYNSSGTAESNNTAVVTGTSVLAGYPDLQVTGFGVTPTTGVQSGASLVLNWQDSNTGTAAVNAAFTDHVVIVNSTTGQTLATTDLPYNPTAAGNSPIAAGGSLARQYDYTLPLGSAGAGNIQFTVTTNYYHQIFEHNTSGPGGSSTAFSNNTSSTSLTAALAPYAVLSTSNVTAPSLTVGYPAQVTIGWTVTNTGTGPGTVSSWVDSIIVSPDNNPAHGTVIKQFPHNGILAVGASYTQSQTFLLPPGYTTHSHLFVQSDGTNLVFENGNESANFGEAPNFFDVVPIPYAGWLVVSPVQRRRHGEQQQQADDGEAGRSPIRAPLPSVPPTLTNGAIRSTSPATRAGKTSSPTWAASTTSAPSRSAVVTRTRSPPTLCPTA